MGKGKYPLWLGSRRHQSFVAVTTVILALSVAWRLGTISAFQTTPTPDEIATSEVTTESIQQSTQAGQIAADELGKFSTGIRFIVAGKTWEILSDIPGITFDAPRTDIELLADQFNTLINVDPERFKYRAPSTHTIRVIFEYESELPQAANLVAMMQTWYGLTTPHFVTPGVLLERIPYGDDFLAFLADPIYFPREADRTINFNVMVMQQIYYGGLIGPSFDWRKDDLIRGLYETLDVPPPPMLAGKTQAEFDRLYETFLREITKTYRGLAVVFDPDLYPPAN